MNTKIIKNNHPSAISTAVYILAKGGIIIAPTETCYGLLADATNRKAVENVFRLKGRERTKALSVFFFDAKEAGEYVQIANIAKRLMKKYLPGPLTLILRKKASKMAKNVSKGKTIGIRISSHPFIIALTYNFRKPITATSANLSGKREIYSIREIVRTFGGKVDLIIDGGNLKSTLPTTVVDFSGRKPKILRQGSLKIRVS